MSTSTHWPHVGLDHKPRHGVPKKLPVGVDVDTHGTINHDYECSFRKVSMAVSGLLSDHGQPGHNFPAAECLSSNVIICVDENPVPLNGTGCDA
jgi:hypothetical protein